MRGVRRRTGVPWGSGHLWPEKQRPAPALALGLRPGRGNRFPAELVACRAGGQGAALSSSAQVLKGIPRQGPQKKRCQRFRPPSADLPNSCTATGMRSSKVESRGSLMAQSVCFLPGMGRKACKRTKARRVLGHPFPSSPLRAALLKRRVEEALTFKGLLKLGKTSNKEISCHMRVVGKSRNSKLQLCFVSEL